MTITITWSTKVINVPKADTTLLQSTPTEIRELNINAFRLALKDIEDGEEGMAFDATHNHNPPVSVGGVTLARVVELINGYTVTFEDGQYAVNLAGANSNIADNVNVNQVSVRSANSAGLVQTREIEQTAFAGAIHLDQVSGVGGTVYPIGTRQNPVNNLADAMLIESLRGLGSLSIHGTFIVYPGQSISGMSIEGGGTGAIIFSPGALANGCVFRDMMVGGDLGGGLNLIRDCLLQDVINLIGTVGGSILKGVTAISGDCSFISCYDGVNPGAAEIDMGGAHKCEVRDYYGGLKISNKTGTEEFTVNFSAGRLSIASTVTGGTIVARGVGEISSNLGTATLNTTGLVNAAAVWTTQTGADTATWAALIGRILQNKQITDPVAGTITVFADDGVTPLLTANLFEDAAGSQAYRGQGAERRDRLV